MMRVIIFFLIVSFESFSQSVTLGKVNEIQKIHFLKENNQLYLFEKDSLAIINLDNFERISKEKIEFPIERFFSLYEITSVKSEIYFIELHGGTVYELRGRDLIRIDKSYTHRMQGGSTIFVHDDTIYRYGGYGFWSMRNLFTFFDLTTSEWSVVSPKGSTELPRGSQFTTVKRFNDDLFLFGGLSLNPFEPLEWEVYKEVWKFDLQNGSWNMLGDTKIDFNSYMFNFSYGTNHVFYGRDDDKMILVDALNNKVKWFKKKNFHYGLNNRFKSFYSDKVFYCVINSYNDDSLTLLKRDEDDFFGELISEDKLYYNNENIYYSIVIFLLVLVFVLVYIQIDKFKKNRNKIKVEDDSIVYKSKILNFDKKCIRIITLLLNSEKEVFSREIMKITENPSLNYGHNTRVMNKTIEEINFKLRSILDCKEDLITFKKSETDKRIKVYSIDKTNFFLKRTF